MVDRTTPKHPAYSYWRVTASVIRDDHRKVMGSKEYQCTTKHTAECLAKRDFPIANVFNTTRVVPSWKRHDNIG